MSDLESAAGGADSVELSDLKESKILIIVSIRIIPILKAHLKKVSSVQWSMLALGMWDSDIQAILASMLIEVIQALSADVLTRFLPDICNKRVSELRSVNLENDVTIQALLQDSISFSLGLIFNSPQEKSVHAQELTRLIENEVSMKATKIATTLIKSPNWPSEPTVYVSSHLSCMKKLHRMIFLAATCIKGYLGTVDPKCFESCWQLNKDVVPDIASMTSEEPEQSESDRSEDKLQRVKSLISLPLATEGVSRILERYSDDSDSQDSSDYSPVSSLNSQKPQETVVEIVDAILDDLHYCEKADSGESVVSFNMKKVGVKLEKYFSSDSSEDDGSSFQSRFSPFAEEQFKQMVSSLRDALKGSEFVVNLDVDSTSTSKVSEEFVLPGFVSDTMEKGSASPMASKPNLAAENSFHMDFKTIKTKVENLGKALAQNSNPEEVDPDCSSLIMEFSKELTDKVYRSLMLSSPCKDPSLPRGRPMSDSVLSNMRKELDSHLKFSPDILYAMTEDAVGRFTRKLLLYEHKKPADSRAHSVKVAGALSDIKTMVSELVTSSQALSSSCSITLPCLGLETKTESNSVPEPSMGDSIAPAVSPADVQSVPKDTKTKEKEKVQEVLPLLRESRTTKASSCTASTRRKTPMSIESVVSVSESIIVPLIMRLIIKCSEEKTKSLKAGELRRIISCLADKVVEEMDTENSVVKMNVDGIKNVVKAIVKDLHREFGSAENILTYAMAPSNSAFEDAVVRNLKVHLSMSPVHKLRGIMAFLKGMGKTLLRAVKCSCGL